MLPLQVSGPGSNDNEKVLHVLRISMAGASPSEGLMSYPGHLLGGGHRDAVGVFWAGNYVVSRNYSYSIIINCLHTVI